MRTVPDATRSILDAIPEVALIVDRAGRIVIANHAAEEALAVGAEDLAGRPLADYVIVTTIRNGEITFPLSEPDDDRPRILPGGRVQPEGGPAWACEVRVSPFGAGPFESGRLILVRDTSEQTMREARIRESTKMTAVKTLATHLANNFNNTLAAISGGIESAQSALPAHSTEARAELEVARAETRRAARQVRRLLNVATPSPSRLVASAVQPVVDECLASVKHDLNGSIRVETEFTHGDWQVTADPEQISDILASLVLNAKDAMPRGGVLRIHTARAGGTDWGHRLPPEMHGREFVRIDVSDTGAGIEPDLLPRIFEPFVTTKGSNQGAGLGLASVYEVLRQHQGGITVESTPGMGTVFHIFVPRVTKAVRPNGGSDVPSDQAAETILVIDDEAPIRRVARRVLERHGFRVIEAVDGQKGLDAWREEREVIRLVLLDILMPNVSGWEVLATIKDADPDVPIVLQSGYPVRDDAARESAARAEAFLQKPYELSDLMQTVQRLLGDRTPAGVAG